MAALPKKKLSKARTARRRSHFKAILPNLVKCSNCGELTLPHRVCPACGYFAGRQVLKVKS